MTVVSYAVEGSTDEPVAERLLALVGATPHKAISARGKTKLDPKIPSLNLVAERSKAAWLVLRDLDTDDRGSCGPAVVERLLGGRPAATSMILRLPVRSLEAWLLADREGFATFFGVSPSRLPDRPDEEDRPKVRLIGICDRSTSKEIRTGMVPRPSSGRAVGARYGELIRAYVTEAWEPKRARRASPSLDRAIDRMEEALATNRWR